MIGEHLTTSQKLFGVAAIGVGAFALYIGHKNASAGTDTSATGGTVVTAQQDNSSLLSAIQGAVDTITKGQTASATSFLQALTDSNTATAGAINNETTAFSGALATYGQNNIAALTQLNNAQTAGFSADAAGFNSVGGGLTATNQHLDFAYGGIMGGVADAVKQIVAAITGSTGTLGARIDQLQTDLTAQVTQSQQATGGLFSQLLTYVTAMEGRLTKQGADTAAAVASTQQSLAALTAPIQHLTSADYYNIGAHSLAACFDNGGISVNCAEGQGRYEAGQHDVDQNWIKSYLQTTYGSCLKNGKYDAVCVGQKIAQTGGFGN